MRPDEPAPYVSDDAPVLSDEAPCEVNSCSASLAYDEAPPAVLLLLLLVSVECFKVV